MARKRKFLDIDVVEAAKIRLNHVYDTFDTVVCQFSGGKDSTAVLYLMKEIQEERGLGPVKAIFRDEEMVSPAVADFIETVKGYDWVEMEHYCLPQGQEVWVLGVREWVLLWSPSREKEGRLVRDFPADAIRAEHFGVDPSKPIPQSIDYYTMQGKVGKTAFVTGVRANESMIRYRSLVQKLNENYIVHPWRLSKSIPLKFAKVIYDWTSADVMKYLVESGAPYCEFYDWAEISGANPRVGIPLHSVAIRRISDTYKTEPEFYDRLVEVFPHIEAQRQLWKDFDVEALLKHYSSFGWDGVRVLINEYMLTPGTAKSAMRFAGEFRKKHEQDPFSYPISNLIRVLFLNEFHGTAPNPVGPKTRAFAVRMSDIEEDQELNDANDADLADDRR